MAKGSKKAKAKSPEKSKGKVKAPETAEQIAAKEQRKSSKETKKLEAETKKAAALSATVPGAPAMVSKKFFLGFGVSSLVTPTVVTGPPQRARQKEAMNKLERMFIEHVGCNIVFEAYNDPKRLRGLSFVEFPGSPFPNHTHYRDENGYPSESSPRDLTVWAQFRRLRRWTSCLHHGMELLTVYYHFNHDPARIWPVLGVTTLMEMTAAYLQLINTFDNVQKAAQIHTWVTDKLKHVNGTRTFKTQFTTKHLLNTLSKDSNGSFVSVRWKEGACDAKITMIQFLREVTLHETYDDFCRVDKLAKKNPSNEKHRDHREKLIDKLHKRGTWLIAFYDAPEDRNQLLAYVKSAMPGDVSTLLFKHKDVVELMACIHSIPAFVAVGLKPSQFLEAKKTFWGASADIKHENGLCLGTGRELQSGSSTSEVGIGERRAGRIQSRREMVVAESESNMAELIAAALTWRRRARDATNMLGVERAGRTESQLSTRMLQCTGRGNLVKYERVCGKRWGQAPPTKTGRGGEMFDMSGPGSNMEVNGAGFSLRKNVIDTIGLDHAGWAKVTKNTIFTLSGKGTVSR
ncbi:hypothetical protein B0H13DRAFT_1876056 [Mycena leptocephala]|nr:hypothetical protein B0H13DRAFT_1876056 [Mycena leptocephala]